MNTDGLSNGEKDAYFEQAFPGIGQPGPQPENQISGSADEQIARAKQGQGSAAANDLAAIIRANPDVFRPVLLEVMGKALVELVLSLPRREK